MALSDLEQAVLGLVYQHAPCTAYAIRTLCAKSRTARFSGSAGSIYPLMLRLEQRGYLRSKPARQGRRRRRDYGLTRKGSVALRRWLTLPLPAADVSLVYDPLRTRMLFQRALPRASTLAFVLDALTKLRAAWPLLEQDCRDHPRSQNEFLHYAARNALLLAQARIAWLEEVAAAIELPTRRRRRGK